MVDRTGHGDMQFGLHAGQSRRARVVRHVDGIDLAQRSDGNAEGDCAGADRAVDGDLVRGNDDDGGIRDVEREPEDLVDREQLDRMVSHREHVADDGVDAGKRFRVLHGGAKEDGGSIPRRGRARCRSRATASTRRGNPESTTAYCTLIGPEFRSPKSEIRDPNEIRSSNLRSLAVCLAALYPTKLRGRIRSSDFGLLSGFGNSDFGLSAVVTQ